MKGYNTDIGYMGYVPSESKYMLFASESDYREWYASTQVEMSFMEYRRIMRGED